MDVNEELNIVKIQKKKKNFFGGGDGSRGGGVGLGGSG